MRGGNGNPALRLTAHNGSGAALHNFMVQFNKNAMGLAPASQVSNGQRRPVDAASSGRGRRQRQSGVLHQEMHVVQRGGCAEGAKAGWRWWLARLIYSPCLFIC